MGANNITVSLTQKSDADYTQGGVTRMFRPTSPAAEDLMTDEMIQEYREAFPGVLYAICLLQSVGNCSVEINTQSASVQMMGVNTQYSKAQDVKISTGRFLNEVDEEKAKKVAVVSDVFCEALFPGQDPIRLSVEGTYGNKVLTFYIVGTYPYENNGFVMESTDDTPTTDLYIPLSTAK